MKRASVSFIAYFVYKETPYEKAYLKNCAKKKKKMECIILVVSEYKRFTEWEK